MIRRALPGDLEEVLRLCAERPRADLPVRAVDGARLRQAMEDAYRRRWSCLDSDPDLHVLVAAEGSGLQGYAVLITGLTESLTGDPQALLYDHAWRGGEVGRALLEEAERQAAELAMERGG